MKPPVNLNKVESRQLVAWIRKDAAARLVRSDIDQVVKSVAWPREGTLCTRIMNLLVGLEKAVQGAGHPDYLNNITREVELVTSKLEPATFRRELELELNRDEHLKQSLKDYTDRLLQKADILQPYVELVERGEKLNQPKGRNGGGSSQAAGGSARQAGESRGSRSQRRRDRGQQKPPEAPLQENPACATPEKGHIPGKVGCFHCGGSHKVQVCPKATLTQKREAWRTLGRR